ncbi:NAD(P)/FAD-dependent oxidoreductase [Agrococcus sp. Ld7]|uniref:NAD(P)/FAD-dependent oxidoreductase n=1 Tax=Agrococcus sp. Ld7 TaxID=649148 RepID=UPI00386E17B5
MSMLESDVLIVGAGAAGHAAAAALRAAGFTGSVRIVHDEPHPPYSRTLVDKAILPGLLTVEQAALKDLTPLGVELVHGRALTIDADRHVVRLQDGRALPYSTLLLAMGSTPRALPGGAGPGVFSLHRAEDALRIRDHLGDDPTGRTVTVLGAGLVGSEVASYFAAAGAELQLVARSDVPLARVLGRPIATRLRDLHAAHVDAHFGRAVTALLPSASHTGVRLDDGSELRSDLVIVAQGTVPDTSWASGDAEGVRVDDRLRAGTIPGAYAAGAAAAHTTPEGSWHRIDHWDDAMAQGAHAARTILHDLGEGEDPGPYRAASGFSLNVYGTSIMGVGTVSPNAVVGTARSREGSIVTTFRDGDGCVTGAVGLSAAREILAIKAELAGRR